MQAMDQDIEKNSPSLGRSAVYHESSRISRLPAYVLFLVPSLLLTQHRSYLTVNLVRFFWRRDINKKTKIMRKVKFPFDLDVIDLLSPTLKKQVLPLNEKLKEVDKDRRERAKVLRRAKIAKDEKADEERGKVEDRRAGIERDPALSAVNMAAAAAASSSGAMVVDEPVVEKKEVADGELVDEPTKRAEEAALLRSLVDPALAKDVGANVTGMYELVAIVTHKGASADGGASFRLCGRAGLTRARAQVITLGGVESLARRERPRIPTSSSGSASTTRRSRSSVGRRLLRSMVEVSSGLGRPWC